jgi:Ca-activated chloride channel family protein
MTRYILSATLAVGLWTTQTPPQQPPPQQPGVFRSAVDTVPVYVTVTDKSDRLVPNLQKEDFEIFDSGKPQPLTLFDNTPQPIHLIVLLDLSGSMQGNLPLMRAACEQLFRRLRPDDVARVGLIGNQITISPTFTRDLTVLMAAIPTIMEPGQRTPLWATVDEAIGDFADVSGRRVVLVLSDSKDTGPIKGGRFYTVTEIIDRAQKEETMVYGVGLFSRMAPGMSGGSGGLMGAMADTFPDQSLGQLALETGGGYIEIRPRDDLSAAFAHVADELHSQYLLGFTPTASDGKLHKVEVKMKNGSYKARARKNYQAPKAAK